MTTRKILLATAYVGLVLSLARRVALAMPRFGSGRGVSLLDFAAVMLLLLVATLGVVWSYYPNIDDHPADFYSFGCMGMAVAAALVWAVGMVM